MKILKLISTTTLTVAISSTGWAQATDPNPDYSAAPEPMISHQMPWMQGGMPMMDPQARREMMQQRQQRMADGYSMPPRGGYRGMMMDPEMQRNMMQWRHSAGDTQDGMKNPQMMQRMMYMRQQHMQQMEKRLANIESLLKELVELQKQQ